MSDLPMCERHPEYRTGASGKCQCCLLEETRGKIWETFPPGLPVRPLTEKAIQNLTALFDWHKRFKK